MKGGKKEGILSRAVPSKAGAVCSETAVPVSSRDPGSSRLILCVRSEHELTLASGTLREAVCNFAMASNAWMEFITQGVVHGQCAEALF